MNFFGVTLHPIVIALTAVVILMGLNLATKPALAHGGKTHADESFTALQAVQKATELYDRLILSGKLAEPWETKLKNIHISTRHNGEQKEYVVRFETDQLEPSSVYFFFDREGAYAGSNFTGK
jgi:hypothetical protein